MAMVLRTPTGAAGAIGTTAMMTMAVGGKQKSFRNQSEAFPFCKA
jgi:hypothetical protein